MMVMELIDGFDLQRLLSTSFFLKTKASITKERWEHLNRVIITEGPVHPRIKAGVAVAIVAPVLGAGPILVFASMAVAGAIYGAVLTLRSAHDNLPELNVGNPLKLSAALQFALFLAVVMVAGRFLADRMGDAGVLLTAAVSGLVDVDAITLSIGRMVAEGTVAAPIATLGLFVAAAVNQVTKLGLVASLDGRALAWRVLPAYAAMAAVGLAVALLQR